MAVYSPLFSAEIVFDRLLAYKLVQFINEFKLFSLETCSRFVKILKLSSLMQVFKSQYELRGQSSMLQIKAKQDCLSFRSQETRLCSSEKIG
jgi:hypothetical protein